MGLDDTSKEKLSRENLELRRRVGELEKVLASGPSGILRSHPGLLQTFLDSLSPVAMLVRPDTHEIVACSRGGGDIGIALGKTCHESWGRSDKPCPWCRAPEARETGAAVHAQFEGLGRLWDSHWIPVGGDLTLHYAHDVTESSRAEDALRESEERFKTFADASFEGIIITEKGRFVDANDRFLKLFGYELDELMGREVLQLVAPDHRDMVMERILSGHEEPYEHRALHKDGSVVDVEVCGRKTSYRGRPCRITALRDISDRERAADALRKSERKFRGVVESSPMGMFETDAEGRVLYTNPEWCSTAGMSMEEGLGFGWIGALHKDDRDWVATQWNECLSEKKGYSGEFRFVRPSGETRWVYTRTTPILDEAGEVIGHVGANEDITDRMRAEEAVRDIARFPGENPSPVLRISLDGRIQYANPASSPLLGTWKREMGDRAPEEICRLVIAARASGDSQMADVAAGDELFSFVVAPAPGADYVNLYGRNVTEHRKLEEQLRQSQKLEAIGQLAGGIAHDFNNLLQSILGYSNMLKMQAMPGSPVYSAADIMEKAGVRASELTKQLLGFARRGKLQNKPVDLHHIVHDTVTIVSRTISKKIDISLRLDADPSVVLGDPSQLEQVVMNLAVNARDAMPDGGVLVVETSNVELDEDYCREHAETTPGPYLLVNVSDTGVGMTNEVRERIFEPFFTTKEPGKGTGMGLAMVYGIVKNHGGSVGVYSTPGTGATFKIYLPVAKEARRADDSREMAALVSGSGTVLVVDDEKTVRQICKDMLDMLGYRALLAGDGSEAVQCYKERGDEIDLVILDMTMPVMDGRECFRRLREIDPNVKVIVSTGHALNGTAQEVIDEGAVRFLQKPFVLSRLSDAVAKVLSEDDPDTPPRGRPEV